MIDPEKCIAFLELISTPFQQGGLLGEPYEEDEGCLKFVQRSLARLGIETTDDLRKEGQRWRDIAKFDGVAQFGDVAVFQNLQFSKYHVALMLDRNWAIQSSRATNGVGRVDITRGEWAWALDKIYRHESLIDVSHDNRSAR